MDPLTIGSLAAGVGGLAGGIGGLFGDKSPSSVNPASFYNLNPSSSTVKWLFGKAPKYLKKYGQDTMFGEDWRNSLQNYMGGTTFGTGGPNLLSTILGSPADYMSGFNTRLGNIDSAINTMSLFNETGLPTDGTAYFNEAIRRLGTDIIPQLAEASGLGVQSGGFANQVARESANLLGQASLANIDLAEAAANRRMSAAPALATLALSRQAAPANLATQLSALFGEEQRRPLDVFSSLSQLGSQGPWGTPSYNPTDPTASYLAAGGAGLSGILQALSNFNFGGSGGDMSSVFNSFYPNGQTGFGGAKVG